MDDPLQRPGAPVGPGVALPRAAHTELNPPASLERRSRALGRTRSQRLLISMIGDHWQEGQAPWPSAGLVRVFEEFGVSPANARSVLSRLTQRGFLDRTREGRRTSYAPTSGLRQLLDRSRERIFSCADAEEAWDGTWTLVAFSVPGGDGNLRRLLRARLRWLTFRPIFDATWVAPRDRTASVSEQLHDLGLADVLLLRSATLDFFPEARARLERAWELGELATAYEAFYEQYRGLARDAAANEVAPAEAFTRRIEILDDWRLLVRDDPDLPREFLPDGFPRETARSLFLDTYRSLETVATRRFAELIDATDPGAEPTG